MQIGIVGAGYVGLSTAVLFAELGHDVKLVDIDIDKVNKINSGEAPIYEPKINDYLNKYAGNRIRGFVNYKALAEVDVIFIAVGTPSRKDGSINLDFVKSAAVSIGKILNKGEIVVVKSTVLPGTTENVVIPLLEKNSGLRAGKDFGVCMNPEFLREGNAIYDSFHPDRIIIGEYDKRSGDILEKLYKPLHAPVLRVNLKTAEMIKYASNALLATKISFANEIANICERIGDVDVYDVMSGVGMDHRISPHFLNAGVGFGGSCFPKDLKALIDLSVSLDYEPHLLKAVLKINDYQPVHLVNRIENEMGELKNKRVCVLGLAFKPDTDDVRESRAIIIVKELLRRGADVIAYDPRAMENFKKMFPQIKYGKDVDFTLKNCEICIIQADWKIFKNIDFAKYKNIILIADGRRAIRSVEGKKYITIGYVGRDDKNHMAKRK